MEYDMYLMLKINCLGEVIYYERAMSFLLLTHFYPIYASVSAYVIRSEESQILSFMKKKSIWSHSEYYQPPRKSNLKYELADYLN